MRLTIGMLTCVCIAACGKSPPASPAERLLGKWTVNVEASVAEDREIRALPVGSQTNVTKVVGTFLGNMTLNFGSDGQLVMFNGQKSADIAYTIEGQGTGQELVVRLLDPSLEENDPRQRLAITYLEEGIRLVRGRQVLILERARWH